MSDTANFRSRSPHQHRKNNSNSNNSSISPSRSPNHKPLWRRRREEAEAADYKERLSPHRKQSISPHRERKLSWHEEDDDDNQEYLDRAERAYAGLSNYEKKFKKYTPDAIRSRDNNNKENEGPGNKSNSKKSTTPIRDRSRSPKPIEIENDADVLIRRQKDVDYGKNTVEYHEYIENVTKQQRKNEQPWTPDKYEKMTRRNWDKQVKIWRKQLHHWRNPKPVKELMTPGTSPCPSPHRRHSSPEREFKSARQLFQNNDDAMDDCAMDGFSTGLKKEETAVQPILTQAALIQVKNEMEDNDDSNMSYGENSEEIPSAFKKH